VRARTTQLVDARAELVATGRKAVPQTGVVDGAARAAFGAGAVVRHDDHEGVVPLPELLDEREHAPDLLVGMREEAGEALHEARSHALVLGFEVGPSRDPGRTG
jgi:hypothetical protein